MAVSAVGGTHPVIVDEGSPAKAIACDAVLIVHAQNGSIAVINSFVLYKGGVIEVFDSLAIFREHDAVHVDVVVVFSARLAHSVGLIENLVAGEIDVATLICCFCNTIVFVAVVVAEVVFQDYVTLYIFSVSECVDGYLDNLVGVPEGIGRSTGKVLNILACPCLDELHEDVVSSCCFSQLGSFHLTRGDSCYSLNVVAEAEDLVLCGHLLGLHGFHAHDVLLHGRVCVATHGNECHS